MKPNNQVIQDLTDIDAQMARGFDDGDLPAKSEARR
jgi:hypothetical protein